MNSKLIALNVVLAACVGACTGNTGKNVTLEPTADTRVDAADSAADSAEVADETTATAETSVETTTDTGTDTSAETTAEVDAAETCGPCGAHASCVEGHCACDAEALAEGDGCVLRVRIPAFRVEPAVVHIDEPLAAIFDVVGATGCHLESELFADPLALDAASLAAERFAFALTRAQFERVAARGDGRVAVTLRCTGPGAAGANTASALILMKFAPGPAIAVTPSARTVPAEGGAVDICWDAPTAAFCAVFGPEGGVEGLGAKGCAEDLAVPGGVDTEFVVQCGDGFADGVGDIAQARVVIGSGAAIGSFEVNPDFLGAPGLSHVTWEVVGADACALERGAESLATGLTGVLDVAVAGQTELTLSCTAGDAVLSETRDIFVGAAIFGFGFWDPNTANGVSWTAYADSCVLAVAGGAYQATMTGLPASGKDAQLPLPLPTAIREAGATVTLTCTAGDAVATKTLVALPVARITTATFDPPALPAGGGTVEFCWTSANTDACATYLDGSGDEAGLYAADDCAVLEVGASMYVRLECWSSAAGVPAVWEGEVPFGGYAELSASPMSLGAAGTTTLAWASRDAKDCLLMKDGAFLNEVADSGTQVVTVDADAVFALRCDLGGQVVDRAVRVNVGAGIESFDVVPTGTGAGVAWSTELVDSCTLTVASAGTTTVLSGLPPVQAAGNVPSGPGPKPKPPKKGANMGLAVPFSRTADATLTFVCTGPFGTFERTAQVVATPPLAITSVVVTPERLPPAGAEVDVCITSQGAEFCHPSVMSLETGLVRMFATPVGVPGFTTGNGCLSTSGFGKLFLDENSEITVTCSNSRESTERKVVVLEGVAITALAADPPWLEAEGSVVVSWQSMLATTCELTRDGAVVGTGLSGDGLSVALTATTTLTLTCEDADGGVAKRDLRIPVGADLAATARATGAYQFVVTVASTGLESCAIVAENGTTRMGSGAEFGREDAPLSGEFYVDWYFADLGRANVTVTCETPSGGTLEVVTSVEAPPAAVIDTFEVPSGFLAPSDADVCFSAHGMSSCDLYVDSVGGYSFGAATSGCWSDFAGAPVSFTRTTGVQLVCYTELGMVTQESAVVAVGPTVLAFTVDKSVVASGEDVVIAWKTYAMDTCRLFQNEAEADAGLAGDGTFTLAQNTEFLLSCTDAAGGVHERTLSVFVGRQIARFNARPADATTISVDWLALGADGCVVRASTAAGVERVANADLPSEGGLGFAWDYAADGPAHVQLVCARDGEDDLVAMRVVDAPTAVVITTLTASPDGASGPTEVDICWSAGGSVDACVVEVMSRAPIATASSYTSFWGARAGCASEAVGYEQLVGLAATSDVRLTCFGPLGSATQTLVIPIGPDITMLRADPAVMDAPGLSTVAWTSHDTTGCTLEDATGKALASGTANAVDVLVEASTLFTLRCRVASGEVTRHLGIGLGASAFIEDAAPISATQLVVSWRAERSDYCTLTLNDAQGIERSRIDVGPVGRQTLDFPFAEAGDAEMHLACFGAEQVEADATLASPAPAIAAFTATPAALASAGPTRLCWEAAQADGCELAFGGSVVHDLGTDDCEDVDVTAAATAVLTCTGDFGAATRKLNVTVGPTITVLDASRVHLPAGGYFTELAWASVLTTDCTLSAAADVVATGALGAKRVFVAADTTFTLACVAGATTVTRTLDVTTGPAITGFTAVPNAVAGMIVFGWIGLYATTCTFELRDVDANAIVFAESHFKGPVAEGLAVAFDFSLGHTASAKLICQDADGQSDEQTLTIAVP